MPSGVLYRSLLYHRRERSPRWSLFRDYENIRYFKKSLRYLKFDLFENMPEGVNVV